MLLAFESSAQDQITVELQQGEDDKYSVQVLLTTSDSLIQDAELQTSNCLVSAVSSVQTIVINPGDFLLVK